MTEPKPTLLIVDDELFLRKALHRILCHSFEILEAEDGYQALDVLERSASVQAILLDLYMPNMDGMALHEELVRRYPRLAKRTLFLTGGLVLASTWDFYEANKDRIVIKPPDPTALRERLLQMARSD